ncbi:ATP/GTP-binding protein [Streptomyces atratus]|uniref:ATP/GTP-binding protein n=1 Tax=Streptomyces atratus TaxID=1893 RepID=UPI002253A707|nr:ATP/GTP-binding protein [Streptomyces atratus]MCX5340469.1 ATP/GTP-binding protein [Streptomyces atratus]
MDTEGTYDSRGTRSGHPVPRPAGPPPPELPPRPGYAPASGPSLGDWLRTPRPAAEPGVWRLGHAPRPAEEKERTPDRTLVSGAVISLLACILVWSLWRNNYIPYWRVPLKLFTPGDWWGPFGDEPQTRGAVRALDIYRLLIIGGLVYGFGRLGNWPAAFERCVAARGAAARAGGAAIGALLVWILVWNGTVPGMGLAFGLVPGSWLGPDQPMSPVVSYGLYIVLTLVIVWPFARLGRWTEAWRRGGSPQQAPGRDGRDPAKPHTPGGADAIVEGSEEDPAEWPDLRAAGQHQAAAALAGETRSGRMNDVDYARIRRAWTSVRADHSRLSAFTDTVLRNGSVACAHPSGARDLPVRAARHDLLVQQVRLGTVEDGERNPYARRGSGIALDPGLLGTSLLAVGPPGAGKSRALIRPVVESLALQALAGQAAVVAVCAAGTQLGGDQGFDVVIKVGDPSSVHDLDLYGGTTDPDEAASVLADGLVGDLPEVDSRRAATALAQLLGPFRAAHSRFPSVPELRELLDGVPGALAALREALDATGHPGMQRELDGRARQSGAPGDPGPALADRVALLDRPAFTEFFDTTGKARPFSLRALEHPLRVRIDLPERGHAEASRLLARLVLAQFTASAAARTDRSLFACLVLDDATHTLTPDTVRGIQRLRSAHAGAVLTLRTLDDVPDQLHTALLGAVGCRMAFSGITTWDGKKFAEAWGTEWVETRDVTQRTVFADQPMTRAIHAFRKLVTGKAVTTDAVTVRQVERERWSASELAHRVPAGHAVLSLTTVRGEHAPPLLVDLNG